MNKTMQITWLGEQRYAAQNATGQQLLIDNSGFKVDANFDQCRNQSINKNLWYHVAGNFLESILLQ